MKLFSRIFSMLVIAFAFSVLFCAPTFAEESLSISVDGVAEVEATPNTLETGTVDVYVTSTSRDGYKLSVSDSDENNALVSNHGDSINPLAESVTESNFTTNAWGIKVGDNFLPVPKLSDNVLELANTSAAATNEKHTVTFGMKVDGTATSGAYSSEVVFTAVANPLVVRKTALKTGQQVNAAWKTLANNSSTIYSAVDNKITSIQKFTGDFTDTLRSVAQDIATADSDWPVYTWFDNGTIYYYTEANEVFFNADSSNMFRGMQKLVSVDFNFGLETDVDPDSDGYIANVQDPVYITSSVTNMSFMFYWASSLTSLDVSNWDTSKVTNMGSMFYNTSSLASLDVSNWDTSSVANMNGMFFSTSSLTSLNISNWDTSSVTNMSSMFSYASSLTSLNISNWDTSSVTNMSSMFFGASSLTSLDVSNWDTSKVTNMGGMFKGASSLTSLNVSNWDTSKVTHMDSMFSQASALTSLDVSNWDTSSVTGMNSMFADASSLTSLDVSNWDTSSVTNTARMFYGNSALASLNVSNWDTGNVTDMHEMFALMHSITALDLSKWDTSKVTDMSRMFNGAGSLTALDVSKWDVSSVTDMSSMFFNNSALTSLDVSKWDTSKVTSMTSMFCGASALTVLDLSGWNTSNVSNMSSMFFADGSLVTIYASTLFDTSSVTSSDYMFASTSKLVGGNGTTYDANHRDKEYARIDAPGTPGYFTAPRAIRKATLQTGKQVNAAWKKLSIGDNATSNYRDSVITSIQKFTGDFTETLQNTAVDIATEDSDYPVYTWLDNDTIYYYTEADEVFLNADSSYMFYLFTKLVSIDFNFDREIALDPDQDGLITITRDTIFNTLNVTDMSYMFNNAYSLAAVDVSKWDTGKVTNMRGLFFSAKSLSTIDVSNWNTSNVTDMYAMFETTSSLAALDVSNWDTSKVIDMSYMFQGASSRTALDLSGLDTGSVIDMSYMFDNASSLTSLDVSNWDTSNVTNMSNMFYGVSSLTSLGVSKWNTGNVTNMNNLFYGARTLTTLDLTGWDTSKVTDMSYMFYNMSSLTTIYASDRFDTSSVSSSAQMFLGANNLVGGNGTVFSDTHREKEYARIDTPTTPGYFTLKSN